MSISVETFPALAVAGPVQNAFIGRIAGLDVQTDRETALARLACYHEQARHELGFQGMAFVTAEQIVEFNQLLAQKLAVAGNTEDYAEEHTQENAE